MDYTMMTNQLTGNYKEVLEKAELYGIAKNIDSDILDEMMMNLFDILLSAQEDHKPIEKIIGNDIEKFCHDYFCDYNLKERLKRFPKKIYHIMKCIFIFEIIDILFLQEGNLGFFEIQSDLGPYFFGFIMGIFCVCITDFILSHTIFKFKKIKKKTYDIFISLLFIVCTIGTVYMSFQVSFIIKSWLCILISAIYIIIYFIIRSLYRYKITGTIRKEKIPKNEYSLFSSFSSIRTSLDINLPKELVKKYEKISKKRVKKGQSELSPNDYLDLLKKENHQLETLEKIMKIFFIILTMSLILIVSFTSELIDTLFFALILYMIEYIIYYIYRKINHKIIRLRQKIVCDCENQGITLTEYVDRQKNHSI